MQLDPCNQPCIRDEVQRKRLDEDPTVVGVLLKDTCGARAQRDFRQRDMPTSRSGHFCRSDLPTGVIVVSPSAWSSSAVQRKQSGPRRGCSTK